MLEESHEWQNECFAIYVSFHMKTILRMHLPAFNYRTVS